MVRKGCNEEEGKAQGGSHCWIFGGFIFTFLFPFFKKKSPLFITSFYFILSSFFF